jgi:hypothetical protein
MSEPGPTEQRALIAAQSQLPAAASAGGVSPLFVMVLGMHRSGTSLCAHVLSALGIDMTEEVDPQPSNPKGQWERLEIVRQHDAVLQLFNRGYLTPFHDLQLPTAWWAEPRVRAIQREIVDFLGQRLRGTAAFGFKDPRTARLLPMWHQILRDLGVQPKVILCLRNPAHVARSLNLRDGLDLDLGEYRWLNYMIEIFRNLRNYEPCAVNYEDWFDATADNSGKLVDFLGLELHQSASDLGLTVAEIVDHELRHQRDDTEEPRQPLVRSFYKLVQRAGEDRAARETIDYIVNQYVTFRQLHRPFERVFEEFAAANSQFELETRQLPALQSAARQRDEAVAAARREADARAASEAECAQLNELLTAREREFEQSRRDLAARLEADERDAAMASMGQQRQDLAERLATAEDDLAAHRTALLTAQGQLATLRRDLAERDAVLGEAAARTDQLNTRVQAQEAELNARETALLDTTRRADERDKAAQAELDALTKELTDAGASFTESTRRARELAEKWAETEARFAEREAELAEAAAQNARRAHGLAEQLAEAEALLAAREASLTEAERQRDERDEAASTELDMLTKELADLGAALAAARRELAERAAEYNHAIEGARLQLAALEDELTVRNAVAAQATQNAEDLATRLEKLDADLVERDRSLAEAEQRAETLGIALADARRTAAEDLAQSEQERASLSENLAQQRRELATAQEEIAEQRGQAAVSEVAVAAALLRAEEAVAGRDAVETDLRSAAAALIVARQTLDERDAAMTEAAAREREVAARLADAEERLGQRDAAANAEQIAAANAELEVLRGELSELEAALVATRRDAAEQATGEAARVEALAVEHETAIRAERQRLAGLRDELAARNAALVEAGDRAEMLSERLETAERELAEGAAVAAAASARADEAERRVATIEAELERHTRVVETARQAEERMAIAEAEAASLRRALAGLKPGIAARGHDEALASPSRADEVAAPRRRRFAEPRDGGTPSAAAPVAALPRRPNGGASESRSDVAGAAGGATRNGSSPRRSLADIVGFGDDPRA